MKNKKTELISLANDIRELEVEKKKIVEKVMTEMRKTAREWSDALLIEDFRKTVMNLYCERFNRKLGTDYFAWNTTETVQYNFENFVKDMMKSDEKFFFTAARQRFFGLKRFKKLCTTRSSVEMEFYDVDESGYLVYNYNGTAYHGLGSVDNSVQQKLTINVTTLSVVDYKDSTVLYRFDSSGLHTLDCGFIDKLVAKKKNKIVKIK
jgi:hypothetical protein